MNSENETAIVPGEPGIYYGVSFEDYVKIDAVNSSSLKNMIVSPRNYVRMKAIKRKPSRAMELGTFFHSMVLEPDSHGLKCYEGTKRGKAWEEFKEENDGCSIVSKSEVGGLNEMAVSFSCNHEARKWIDLQNGDSEVTIIFVEQLTGILCKARIDFLDKACRFFTDLKTSRAVDTHGFTRQFTTMNYHFQFAFYQMAINSVYGVWPDAKCVAVQNCEPYDTVCYNVSPLALTEGKKLVLDSLAKLQECQKLGVWPGICNETIELDLAPWAIPDQEIEESGGGEK